VIEGIAISPDGRWLAFDSDRQGNQDIYRMPAAGGDPVQLTTSPDDEFVSSWSGDGREIALHAYHDGGRVVRIVPSEGGEPRDGRSSVWSMPAAGGAPRLLVRFDDPSRPSTRPEFATDGTNLYFTIGARQSDVWAMELRPHG